MSYGLFTYRPGGERRLLGIEEIKDDGREVYGRAFIVHPIDNPARDIITHIDYLYIDQLYNGEAIMDPDVLSPVPPLMERVAA